MFIVISMLRKNVAAAMNANRKATVMVSTTRGQHGPDPLPPLDEKLPILSGLVT